MPKAATAEFKAEIDDRFPTIRIVGTSIGARCDPDEMLSPTMGVWTDEAAGEKPIAEELSAITADLGEVVERRPIKAVGFSGEFINCRDSLKDYETGKRVPWFRMRAMLESPAGDVRLHATAMCCKDDLEAISAAFHRMLNSVEFVGTREAAVAARREGDRQVDAILEAAKAKFDEGVDAFRAHAEAAARERRKGPWPDAETRFGAVLAETGLDAHRAALRAILAPALLLTEAAPDDGVLGASRVGGGPDLPDGVAWPRDASGLHLNFLAQVDLAEIAPRQAPLPETGLLSFFSGTDLSDGLVIHSPAGPALVRHALPEDAEELSEAAFRLLDWSKEAGRFVVSGRDGDGLVAEAEPDGRVRFLRDGEPVVALASEYEIAWSPQRLRVDPTLIAPFADPRYAAAGLDDPFAFWEEMRTGMAIGDGPQHQMFGPVGDEESGRWSAVGRAVEHAREKGWDDIARPEGWFALLALRSGGETGFSFNDHGMFAYMAHETDTARGDFSRVFAFVESS